MWLAVCDSSDREKLNEAAQSRWVDHWEYTFTRHGSPLKRADLVFCFGFSAADVRFPALAACPEECDLVLFYLPDVPRGRLADVVDWPALPKSAQNATAANAIVAVEITTQNPNNSNALQRMGRVFDHARAGIPLLYVCPESAIRAETGAGIAGHHGDDALEAASKDLVKRNQVVDAKSVRAHPKLAKLSPKPLSGPFHPLQGPSAWTALAIRVAGDTYQITAGLILLDCTWSEIPDGYRWSGTQLAPLWGVLAESMVAAESKGLGPARGGGPAFSAAVATSTDWAAKGMGRGGHGTSHSDLEADGVAHGFPRGAVRRPGRGYRRKETAFHYVSPSREDTIKAYALGTNPETSLTNWFGAKRVNRTLLGQMAALFQSRRLLLQVEVNATYVSKDTYTGRLTEFLDHCFVRADPDDMAASRPRAVHPSPGKRRHVLCYVLPIRRWQLDEVSDVYGSRWLAVGDLVRLSDEVVVGQPLAALLGVPAGTTIAWR